MITSRVLLDYVKAQPFRPFRINMASGRSYEIRHPENVRVTKTGAIIFTSLGGETDVPDYWESVSLVLIESVSFLDAPVSHA